MDLEEVFLASNFSKTTLSLTPTMHSTNQLVKFPLWGLQHPPRAATSSSRLPSLRPPPHTLPPPRVETSLSNLTSCLRGTTLSASLHPDVSLIIRVIQEE